MSGYTVEILFLSSKALYTIVDPRMSRDFMKHFNYCCCGIKVHRVARIFVERNLGFKLGHCTNDPLLIALAQLVVERQTNHAVTHSLRYWTIAFFSIPSLPHFG